MEFNGVMNTKLIATEQFSDIQNSVNMTTKRFKMYNSNLALAPIVYPEQGIIEIINSDFVSVVCQSIGFINGREMFEGDYDLEGKMLVFCEECMGFQFAEIDYETKEVVVKCHACELNFWFRDYIDEFFPIRNINDKI
jgi:hypothetical protein